MAGLVAAIYVSLTYVSKKDVDARQHKAGHDEEAAHYSF
jgi:hypothetical protein